MERIRRESSSGRHEGTALFLLISSRGGESRCSTVQCVFTCGHHFLQEHGEVILNRLSCQHISTVCFPLVWKIRHSSKCHEKGTRRKSHTLQTVYDGLTVVRPRKHAAVTLCFQLDPSGAEPRGSVGRTEERLEWSNQLLATSWVSLCDQRHCLGHTTQRTRPYTRVNDVAPNKPTMRWSATVFLSTCFEKLSPCGEHIQ